MSKIKVVVWDNIGNTMLGMRSWEEWPEGIQERLLTEDPDAKAPVVSFATLFPNDDVEIVWLYDPVKYQRGFTVLFHEHEEWIRPIASLDVIRQELADADFLIMHKETLPPDTLQDASKLRLIQHLVRIIAACRWTRRGNAGSPSRRHRSSITRRSPSMCGR